MNHHLILMTEKYAGEDNVLREVQLFYYSYLIQGILDRGDIQRELQYQFYYDDQMK